MPNKKLGENAERDVSPNILNQGRAILQILANIGRYRSILGKKSARYSKIRRREPTLLVKSAKRSAKPTRIDNSVGAIAAFAPARRRRRRERGSHPSNYQSEHGRKG